MLDLVGDAEMKLWMSDARAHAGIKIDTERAPATVGGNPLR